MGGVTISSIHECAASQARLDFRVHGARSREACEADAIQLASHVFIDASEHIQAYVDAYVAASFWAPWPQRIDG